MLSLRGTRTLVALVGWAAIGLSVEARALTVPFGDTTHYWPGYGNGSGDDAADTIGTPNLTGGRAIVDAGGLLTRVEIDYTGPMSPVASGTGRVIPGDLFLDAGADGVWDYVVRLVAAPETPVGSYASLSILDVGTFVASYELTASDNGGHWAGYLIRDAHPYAWTGGGTAVGSGSLDPFDPLASGGTLGFDLGLGLDVGTTLRIGFAENCANDVLYESVAVPEPGTALLLAAGVAALARRRGV